nr:SPOR domain-containing protein [Stakelama flava]
MSVPGSELGVTAPARTSTPEPSSQASATPSQSAAKKAPEKPPKPKAKPAAEANPARHWVQVAGGANEDALARTYAKLAADAPDLFKGRQPWTTPLRATNRILVGPFDSTDSAQDFVNALAKKDMSGFVWTSEAGQAIDRLKVK